MSAYHPGYVYRLTGKTSPDAAPFGITDWMRNRSDVAKRMADCIAEDRSEGICTVGVYNIECLSADMLA